MSRVKTKSDVTTRTLQDLGLGENEAVLYSLMLARPPSTVRELAVLSPFPRTLLYHVLNQLIQRGLISSKKEAWRTTYTAENPDSLYDLLGRKEREFEQKTEIIKKIIPRLKQRYQLAGKRPSVRVFEGVVEYEKVLEDCLVSGAREIYAYEQLVEGKSALETRLAHERRRVSRKLKKNILFFEDKNSLQFLAGRPYNDYTNYRGIKPGTVVPFEIDVTFYSGKILYTSYYDPHQPTALLIEDLALYTMQKNIFDALWREGRDRTLYYTEVK